MSLFFLKLFPNIFLRFFLKFLQKLFQEFLKRFLFFFQEFLPQHHASQSFFPIFSELFPLLFPKISTGIPTEINVLMIQGTLSEFVSKKRVLLNFFQEFFSEFSRDASRKSSTDFSYFLGISSWMFLDISPGFFSKDSHMTASWEKIVKIFHVFLPKLISEFSYKIPLCFFSEFLHWLLLTVLLGCAPRFQFFSHIHP